MMKRLSRRDDSRRKRASVRVSMLAKAAYKKEKDISFDYLGRNTRSQVWNWFQGIYCWFNLFSKYHFLEMVCILNKCEGLALLNNFTKPVSAFSLLTYHSSKRDSFHKIIESTLCLAEYFWACEFLGIEG